MSNETMTRAEWQSRYAAQLVKVSGIDQAIAESMAFDAAEENLTHNGDVWLDPEEDADVDMSYWENGEP